MTAFNTITPDVRISLQTEKGNFAYGPGIAALCRGVRDTGSLNRAAKNMHMAYSKAWRIIKETEESLGFMLLNRDGARGSTLTDEAVKLLDAYDALSADAQAFAEKRLAEIFEKN
jgi:molybdate transport system regulatory protein